MAFCRPRFGWAVASLQSFLLKDKYRRFFISQGLVAQDLVTSLLIQFSGEEQRHVGLKISFSQVDRWYNGILRHEKTIAL